MVTKITVLGGGGEVGRGALAVEHGNRAVLMDYGVTFDENDVPQMPLHVAPSRLDALVLTHSHLDHVGGAPLLYASLSPRALATSLTRAASRILLEDFLKLSGYYLDFEDHEVNKLLASIEEVAPGEEVEVGSFKLKFLNAGHVPGSLSVLVETSNKSVLYTSDVNTVDTKLTKGADFSGIEAEVLVMESTYGSSDHPPRSSVERRFVEAVREVIEGGGVVLVPAFSVGRGQEIMCVLAEHEVEPVAVDGMIREATDVLLSNGSFIHRLDLLEKAREEFEFVRGWHERRRVWRRPGVIVASAGMLKGGPSRYYLRKIAHSEKNAIFMVSFQAPGTPGRKILEMGRYNEGEDLVKARVEWFDFSSHAGSSELLKIAKSIRGLELVVLVHGERKAQEALARRMKEEIGVEVIAPLNGESLDVTG
ncbi:MAG: MBL fold metallo-hydrolase [Fervidicoccaceae archaeon]